jgi:hypothetical protein
MTYYDKFKKEHPFLILREWLRLKLEVFVSFIKGFL